MPARGITSRVVSVESTELSPNRFGLALRRATPPLFTRIEEERIIIDARTVTDDEVRIIGDVFRQVCQPRE